MAVPLAVPPTRMELLKLRQRVGLAQRGNDLLREKMDALVIEFFEVVRRIQEARAKALEQLSVAHRALSMCFAIMGTLETKQASREAKRELQVEISTRHIMGIAVPAVEVEEIERNALMRGYGLHMTSSVLDEASREFERALKLLIGLAELEGSAFAIARELEKTKRRVNALEYILIPRLKEAIKFIVMKLDEMERENFIRLKRIKAMLEERE
ncbi:MAG: V-type ATP synthase subunit D [Hadesarchaea archaeon]|nr:MAG: V-type ATP synthase subunit D [Hadesarchaea archaeon]TKJ27254.1 MAG: V-type ATP synthase subunit D [Hadesarchaea archaeon B3_Hades]